ncbi:hypothetical protein [Sulfurimonas sp.]|uniref:hypothetical protein n=1 Tax=Sulfurimonas sp. TaxID=2022749 RepID=UPI002602024B|nr:hypothetical protein [Sulfurimonas sp.]MDD3451214.1 hypothetical protein [Sulfurimonas sp.]
MRGSLFGVGLGTLFLLFSGCSHKEALTSSYYPSYTKDEILLAGKYAFKSGKEYEYIVDSYRDRLEVTKIGVGFYVLHHKDYLLKVEEDACGTMATLEAEGSFGVEKTDKYLFSQSEHLDVWEKIEYFLAEKNREFFIKPTKDMSTCIIKSEFENGLIKKSEKN